MSYTSKLTIAGQCGDDSTSVPGLVMHGGNHKNCLIVYIQMAILKLEGKVD